MHKYLDIYNYFNIVNMESESEHNSDNSLKQTQNNIETERKRSIEILPENTDKSDLSFKIIIIAKNIKTTINFSVLFFFFFFRSYILYFNF